MTVLEYLQDLISFESTSNLSNVDIADYVQSALTELGFDTERIEYDDKNGVRKASVVGKQGAGAGGMAYAGHTDVVPADDWFQPEHGPYRAVVDGDWVHVPGYIGMDYASGMVSGYVAQQTHQVFCNINWALAEADLSLDDVVRIRVSLDSREDFEIVAPVLGDYIRHISPANTTRP